MIYLENAKLMDAEEIKELMDETSKPVASETGDIPPETIVKPNPTMDRLAFIEAKAVSGKMLVCPCFLGGYSEEPTVGPVANRPKLTFYIYIVQCMKGEYGLLQVGIKEEELGVTKRIWDRPPTKGLREETLWVPAVTGDVQ